MEITVEQSGKIAVIRPHGRLDLASGAELKQAVKDLLGQGRTTLHLNLGGVEFINSCGLGALVSTLKETRLLKGRLTLSNLGGYVQELFDITQLGRIFEIFRTEEEALSSYRTMVAD